MSKQKAQRAAAPAPAEEVVEVQEQPEVETAEAPEVADEAEVAVEDNESEAEVEEAQEEVQEETPEAPVAEEPKKQLEPTVEKVVAEASTPFTRMMEEQRKEKGFGVESKRNISEMILTEHCEKVLNHPNVQYLVSVLSSYVERMSPKAAIEEIQGGQEQTKLAKLYEAVLSYEPELAQICLGIIVSVVREHRKGAFDEMLSLRFPNTMLVNQDQAIRFQMLTVLFTALADGTKKAELGTKINVGKLIDQFTDRQAKANLSEFLN